MKFEDAEDFSFASLGQLQWRPSRQHIAWLNRTAKLMAEEYAETFKATSSNPGRAQESGHTIEKGWKAFLTGWLPPQYEVVTRKYIVGEIDTEENREETDLVILRPSYPRSLRDEAQILAGGVAAAFSVKSTLDSSAIYEAAESCAVGSNAVLPGRYSS